MMRTQTHACPKPAGGRPERDRRSRYGRTPSRPIWRLFRPFGMPTCVASERSLCGGRRRPGLVVWVRPCHGGMSPTAPSGGNVADHRPGRTERPSRGNTAQAEIPRPVHLGHATHPKPELSQSHTPDPSPLAKVTQAAGEIAPAPASPRRYGSRLPVNMGAPGRRGGTCRPSGRSSPVSSKSTTPLQSRLQPCSGCAATVRAASRSGAAAAGHGGM